MLNLDPEAGPDSLPCPECPQMRLEEYMTSARGQLISLAIELDFAVQAGLNVGLEDLTYLEFLLLRVLNEERNKYQIEQMKQR